MQTSELKTKKTFSQWMKKVGFWGFMFFLVKGLVWLAIGYFAVSA